MCDAVLLRSWHVSASSLKKQNLRSAGEGSYPWRGKPHASRLSHLAANINVRYFVVGMSAVSILLCACRGIQGTSFILLDCSPVRP